MESRVQQPIFVVGVPRSGTTLLQSLLSAHSHAYSLPETHYFSTVLPRLHKSAKEPFDEERLSDALALLQDLMDFRPSDEQRTQLIVQATQGELTGRYLFEFVLECYRPLGGERLRVIEKTPLHLEHMPEIFAIFPDARFVHIVRDSRNTISSLLETTFAPTRWLFWYTQYWNYALSLSDRFSKQYPDTILTVRYETLVEDTSSTLQGICEFLGIQFEGEMVAGFSTQQERNVLIDREPWKNQRPNARIHNDPDIWKNRLRPSEAWLIERFTRHNMERYGYRSLADPTWREKTKIFWQSLRQPHSDRQAAQMGHYLIGRCTQQRLPEKARLLAACLAISDMGQIRNPDFRRTLLNRPLPS